MIAAGGGPEEVRVKFAMRMGMTVRLWKATTDQLAKAAGYEGCSLIPLYHLAMTPAGLTQVELSRRMNISESSVVRILRPLLDRQLVSRTRMIGDGRARLIKLEARGADAIEAFEPRAAALRARLLDGISEADIELATSILTIVTERLSEFGEAELFPD